MQLRDTFNKIRTYPYKTKIKDAVLNTPIEVAIGAVALSAAFGTVSFNMEQAKRGQIPLAFSEISQTELYHETIGGQPVPFSLARIPQGSEVRGNLAAGGKGVAQPLSDRDREIAETVRPRLAQRGLLLVGLDVIGSCLTEINVTSPTCFQEIQQQTGFDVPAIRTLLSLQDDPDQPCARADEIAKARLVEVDERLARLQSLRRELRKMIEECACGRVGECRVIETLAEGHEHGRLGD